MTHSIILELWFFCTLKSSSWILKAFLCTLQIESLRLLYFHFSEVAQHLYILPVTMSTDKLLQIGWNWWDSLIVIASTEILYAAMKAHWCIFWNSWDFRREGKSLLLPWTILFLPLLGVCTIHAGIVSLTQCISQIRW